jgi:hypothetical protein
MRKNTPVIIFEAMVGNLHLTTKDLMDLPVLRRRNVPVTSVATLRRYTLEQIAAREGWGVTIKPGTAQYLVTTQMAVDPDLSLDDLMHAAERMGVEVTMETVAAMHWRSRIILKLWAEHGGRQREMRQRLAQRAQERALELYADLKAFLDLDLPGVPDDLRFDAARLIARIERPPTPSNE